LAALFASIDSIERTATSAPDLFVGRARELSLLAASLGGLAKSPRSVLVEGEAGIGKSALVRSFTEPAEEGGVRVWQAACYKDVSLAPYAPLQPILESIQHADGSGPDTLSALASKVLGEGDWRELGTDVRGHRTRFLTSASRAIAQAIGSEPAILCVEDLQWADSATLLLLNRLLDERPLRLMLIGTLRREDAHAQGVLHLLGRLEQRSRRIDLGGLSLADTRELLRCLNEEECVSDGELRTLRKLTSGNPLFLREWFLHLQESGMLDRHTLAEAVARGGTPTRLSHIVDARLVAVDGRAARSLTAAAVVGGEFRVDLVASVLNCARDAVREDLETCVARGVLRRTDSVDHESFAFTHALFEYRTYEMISAPERRRLHRAAAEAGASGSVAMSRADLPRHFALGRGARGGAAAIDCCREAAESAEAVLAFETAARNWELALRCTPGDTTHQRAELLRRLGWAAWAATNWEAASRAWSAAVDLFEKLGDREQAAVLMLALGDVFRWQLQLTASEQWLKRALAVPLRSATDRARSLALLGSIRCLKRDTEAGLDLLEEAEQLAGDSGGDPVVSFWSVYGLLMAGKIGQGLSLGHEALARAQRTHDAHAVSLLAGLLFHADLSALKVGEARRDLRALKEFAGPSDVASQIYVLINGAWIAGLTGRWRAVRRSCAEWLRTMRFAGSYQRATARCLRAQAELALGDPAAACVELERALPDLETMQPLANLHFANALAAVGDSARATSVIRSYLEELGGAPPPASAATILGLACSSIDAPDLWERCYGFLESERAPLALVYSAVSVQRVLGRLASRLRRWPAAIAHFDSALAQLRPARARWELAQTCLDYAGMRRARNHRGDRQRAAALEAKTDAIMGQLGITIGTPNARAAAASENAFGLSGRELEILLFVARGLRNPEIAEALTISPRTVERHLENLFTKMGARNRTEAVVEAAKSGMLIAADLRSPTVDAINPAWDAL